MVRFKGLPRADRARLGIPRGERTVGWGMGEDGPIAATDRALYIEETQQVERIPWLQIERASWEPPELLLWMPAVRRLRMTEPRDLPQAVRACVTDSVIVSERIDLAGGKGALMVARRSGDEVRWSVVFDAGLDPGDPAARAAVEERLGDLRRSLGI